MSADRWTRETAGMLQDLLNNTAKDCGCGCGHDEDVILAALADAGLLVEPGGETQTEWGYRSAIHGQQYPCEDEAHARRHVKWLAEQGQPVGDIMRRTIHTGPWLPDASLPSAAAPAGADSPGAAASAPRDASGVGWTPAPGAGGGAR